MDKVARILVVDDDANLRKTLADILRVKGYDCLVAANGVEAVAAAMQARIDLALIDLMLPDTPGLEVMERIKAVSPLTEAIILTGHASMDTAIEATKRGAFSYLVKPYRMEELLLDIRHGAERSQAQVEIRLLSEALRQTQQPIVISNAALRIEYVNPAFSRLFGYMPEEVIGGFVELLAAPDDQTNRPEQAAATVLKEGAFNGEVLRRAKDGRVIPVLLNVAPVRDDRGEVVNFVSTMADLAGIRHVEQSLRESEEMFRSISSAAQDAVIMLDENGAISFWNTAAEAIFGYAASEALGKDLHLLLAPVRYHETYLAGFARFRISGEGTAIGKTLELAAMRKDGSEFPIEVSLSAVRRRNTWQAIGIVRDISERKRAERETQRYVEELTRANTELKELNRRFEQAQSQLLQSEKMASIGLLAAGVAHEINNPIGFVNSNLGTLNNYVKDFLRLIDAYEKAAMLLPATDNVFAVISEVKRQADIAYEKDDVLTLITESQEGIDRVKKIVQNLKDFSHIETDERWKEEDIHQGLESTLTVVWNEIKYNCEVRKEYGDLPPVQCLLSQLNQVFMNLLVNAAQAIESRGIITIRTGVRGDAVWVEIVDTGKGIPPENLGRIFDPFFTTKPVGKGTGLGLSVSYSIVHKHHGRIEVESEVGKGTTFRVWLPVKQPSDNTV